MEVFILIAHLATGPEPTWAYRDPAECWEVAKEVRREMNIPAECRAATITTKVGSFAPLTSPRPLPKPEFLHD